MMTKDDTLDAFFHFQEKLADESEDNMQRDLIAALLTIAFWAAVEG